MIVLLAEYVSEEVAVTKGTRVVEAMLIAGG